jgi:hypothetical protein
LPVEAGPGGGVETPSIQTIDTQVVGRADFPQLAGGYGVQAASEYLTNGATLTLVSLSDNMTVVTGRTQADGTFVLPINGFTPLPNTYYLLEASRGLGNHAAGNAVARFRTFLRWTGTAWTSISGGTIVINAQTTAVAIISSLDVANVPVPGTMGKISGTSILPTPVLNGHDDAEIFSLASTLSNYLTNDFDPVGSSTGLTPRITALQPANPTLNGATVITGNGFSPIPTGNIVRFEGATASIFTASPTSLGVFVPGDAPNFGNVTVETATGISSVDNAYYTISASGGGGSGGGDGGGSGEGTGGFAISALQPALGVPGDTIQIRGSGFASNPVSNTVVFSQGATASVSYADPSTLIVQVPEDAISGALRVTVAGSTRGFFFNVNLPTIASFTPHDGDHTSVVTIRGQNFGTQHSTSRVLFNNLPMSSFIRWSPNEIVLNAPAPTLAQRVTGQLSIINDQDRLGRLSADTFTARSAYDETFATTTLRHANTTADWSGSQLRPGAVTPVLNHSGRQLNEGNYVTNNFISFTNDGARLLSRAVRHHDGTVTEANNSYTMQMGVDDSFYYLSGYTNATNARRRYSLLTGAMDAQWTQKDFSYESKIWDPTNQVYYTYYYARGRRSPGWNSAAAEDLPNAYVFNYSTSYYFYSMATNGSFLLSPTNAHGWAVINLGQASPYSTYTGVSLSPASITYSQAYSMAGFSGYPRILVQDSTGDISSLKSVDLGGLPGSTVLPTATVALPGMSLNRFGTSNNLYPRIGSDGVDLYVLAKNPMINGNADSLIKFNLNRDTHTLTRANAFDAENVLSGMLTSPVITLPANNLWHTLEFGHGAPAGTSLTVDILNADTGQPIPNWTNLSHGADLNTLTTPRIQLRATLTGTPENSPTLNWWRVTRRGSLALSQGFDTGSLNPIFETQTVTRDNENFTIHYQSSAGGTGGQDTWTWSAWNTDPTALTGRYIRFRVVFNRSNGRLTRVRLPYTY